MERLPLELLVLVCSFLPRELVPQFRLVARKFAAAGTQYLVAGFRVYLTERHLRRLTQFAKTSFAQDVCTLEYVATTFKSVPDHTVARHRTHLRIIDEQAAIQNRRAESSCFLHALDCFPRLKNIVLFCSSKSFDYYHWKDDDAFEGLARPPTCKEYPLSCLHIDELIEAYKERASSRRLEILLRVLSHTANEIQGLAVFSLDWHFFQRDDRELTRLLAPLQKLQHLYLEIDNDWPSWRDDPDDSDLGDSDFMACRSFMQQGVLARCLSSLKELRTLKVSFTRCDKYEYTDTMRSARLTKVMPADLTWSHLTLLWLAHMETSRQELTGTLLRHKDTLRETWIEGICLRASCWTRLLPELRDSLNLTKATFDGVITGHYEDEEDGMYQAMQLWNFWQQRGLRLEVEQYVIRGGVDSPSTCPLTFENDLFT
ncbi:Uu.00g068270.m01.CDS01 [Anthostomella pinea]|uniref:Uu.00g068270.m01.CDS01 n=1 Tax=Anthostomella pinea TaxID=933095 RepID=A0AAI8VUA2_9PEZI|nr:Uu.00g068270.m01.CDS01 [Anthostomella pinea]